MKIKLMKNKKYFQQKNSLKVFVPETATDFAFRISKSYAPCTCKFGNAFCADSPQALQVKN